MTQPIKKSVKEKSAEEIVAELEKPHSSDFTEAAHAEMMRRFIVSMDDFKKGSERNTKIVISLTILIVLLTSINLLTQLLNYKI